MLTQCQYFDLPQEIKDRMPSAYTRVLRLPFHTPVIGGELHQTILNLARSYHLNFDMVFPSLSDIPILVQYAKHLHLPRLFALNPASRKSITNEANSRGGSRSNGGVKSAGL